MKDRIAVPVIFLLAVAFIMTGLKVGSVNIDWTEILGCFTDFNKENVNHFIILELRLPRLLLTLTVGGALALSGYLMQAMVNNPLADPYILGTASGAALGANIAMLGIFPAAFSDLLPTSVFAFSGAFLVTLLAVFVAADKQNIIPSRLLLAGIALSSLMVALTTLLIYSSASDTKLKKVIFWSMGSFENGSWNDLPFIAIILVTGTLIFFFFTKHLNILLLGESRATGLGVNVVKFRWAILCGAAFLTAVSVSLTGPVGFVGLMVPHFVRGVFGVHGSFNIIYTVICGGLFLMVCDIVSRMLFPDAALPVGIITSFLGIPFFVYLLTKRNYRFS